MDITNHQRMIAKNMEDITARFIKNNAAILQGFRDIETEIARSRHRSARNKFIITLIMQIFLYGLAITLILSEKSSVDKVVYLLYWLVVTMCFFLGVIYHELVIIDLRIKSRKG